MTTPYAPGPPSPQPYSHPAQPQARVGVPFVLAAIGAWITAIYWAAVTLIIGLGVALGSGSFMNFIMPCVLIGLYALRGFQIFKGDPRAAQRIIWLHGIGCISALSQVAAATSTFVVGMQVIKIVINILGGVAAFYAYRSFTKAQAAHV
jgi:hypothetical protein